MLTGCRSECGASVATHLAEVAGTKPAEGAATAAEGGLASCGGSTQ